MTRNEGQSFRGTVYVVQEFTAEPPDPLFLGHWENADGIVDGPGWSSIEEAVSWGRERAPVVLVMTGTGPDVRHWSAGAEIVEEFDNAPVRQWLGSVPQAKPMADYGGAVFLQESPFEQVRLGDVRAVWVADSPREHLSIPTADVLAEQPFKLLEDAVAWGRARAPVVLVRESGTDAEWLTAGGTQPRGHQLKSWQPITLRPRRASDESGPSQAP